MTELDTVAEALQKAFSDEDSSDAIMTEPSNPMEDVPEEPSTAEDDQVLYYYYIYIIIIIYILKSALYRAFI